MPEPVTVLMLGKAGDLLNTIPAYAAIAAKTGHPVRVIVSQKFSSVLEGASYVEPIITGLDWIVGVPEARRIYPQSICCQFWLDPDAPEFNLARTVRPPVTTLTINGRTMSFSLRDDQSYDSAMWRRLGFSRKAMLAAPLVLDRRDAARESELAAPYLRSNKPLLLVNLVSPSSPFTFLPEVVGELVKLAPRFTLVDLSRIRGVKLFDMLGLYDRAAGMVTCDSSTLHLAPASKLPYAAFTADGWRGSTPRGNCAWSCPYSEAMDRLQELLYVVNAWAETPAPQALANAIA
jgi:hypothetical protein